MDSGGDYMAEKKEVVQETKYQRDVLISNSKAIFGVNREVTVGALYGNTKNELTKSEVKEAINKFLKTKPKGGSK